MCSADHRGTSGPAAGGQRRRPFQGRREAGWGPLRPAHRSLSRRTGTGRAQHSGCAAAAPKTWMVLRWRKRSWASRSHLEDNLSW